jgi:hypothetical protein
VVRRSRRKSEGLDILERKQKHGIWSPLEQSCPSLVVVVIQGEEGILLPQNTQTIPKNKLRKRAEFIIIFDLILT